MKKGGQKHRRCSIRLQGYDYSQPGAYFITICTQDSVCLFGDIIERKVALNASGRTITMWYSELERKFGDIRCDAFVCMPNHIHFILVNVGADLCVRPDKSPDKLQAPVYDSKSSGHAQPGQTHRSAPTGSPLPSVVQWFKTMTTNAYIQGVKQHGWPPFPGRLWQRNYWEHVIRSETELTRLREYIQNNPVKWELDQLNPAKGGPVVRYNK